MLILYSLFCNNFVPHITDCKLISANHMYVIINGKVATVTKTITCWLCLELLLSCICLMLSIMSLTMSGSKFCSQCCNASVDF